MGPAEVSAIMDTMEPPATGGPVEDVGKDRDYVAIDDSGAFTYHGSSGNLLAALEYAAEATCIIDRAGTFYSLILDRDRGIVLSRALGQVELDWLRQAWVVDQHVHAGQHRIRRFYPETLETLIVSLFEVLALEQGAGPGLNTWRVSIDARWSDELPWKDIESKLAGLDHLEHVHVRDPYGHSYRPIRRRNHTPLPLKSTHLWYIEVPATAEAATNHPPIETTM